MCDPTVLAIASTAAGVIGSGVEYMGQMSAQNEQKKQYEAWAAQQSKNRAAETARQEDFRQQSQAAQQQGLADVSADAQKKAQADEQARLQGYLNSGNEPAQDQSAPTAVSDKFMLSGQKAGEETFQSTLAKKINEATTASRDRINALAKVSSYGGSYGGLDTTTSEALARSGAGIDVTNDLRRGSLGAYGTEQAVNPVQINYQPGPMASLAPQLISFGGGLLGQKFAGGAGAIGSAATPKYAQPIGPNPIRGNFYGGHYGGT